MPVPTTDDVLRIGGMPDPVVRNLQITQSYFELSQETAKLAGAGANWCTFVTWASRQAAESGVVDWSDRADRTHFITDFLRC